MSKIFRSSSILQLICIALIYLFICHISIFSIRAKLSIVSTFASRSRSSSIIFSHAWVPCKPTIVEVIEAHFSNIFLNSIRTTSFIHHLSPEEFRMLRPYFLCNRSCNRTKWRFLIYSRTSTPFSFTIRRNNSFRFSS